MGIGVLECHCGSAEKEFVFEERVARCLQCGQARNYPLPYDENSAEEAYADFKFDKLTPTFIEEKKRIRKPYLDVVKRYFPMGKLLDVGSGTGFFSLLARDAGFEVKGVELCADKVRWVTEHLGLDVTAGFLDQAGFEDGSFDAVCALAILEHVLNPLAFLKDCHNLVKPEGGVVIAVPNYRGIMTHIEKSSLTGVTLKWLQPDQHCWQFEPETLVKLMEQAGFKRVQCFARPQYRHDMLKITGLNAPKVWLRKRFFEKTEKENCTPEMMAVGFKS